MTTKDQAIALESSQEAADAIAVVMKEYSYPANPANCARVGWRAARLTLERRPPEPDCRTCKNYEAEGNAMGYQCLMNCINGDKYEPAPKVVLWRTE
jgi:hypothetical protein